MGIDFAPLRRAERKRNDETNTGRPNGHGPGGSAPGDRGRPRTDPSTRSTHSAVTSATPLVLQPTLTVGRAADPLEREADRLADDVVRILGAPGSRSDTPQHEPAPAVRRTVDVVGRVRRATSDAMTIGLEGGVVDADTDRAIRSARGGGSALPDSDRTAMEGAFGADFGSVRVHARATELNDRIQASAFTVGSDIFFRGDVPDTGTSSGRHLLAHELAHTVQQGAAPVQREVARRSCAAPADRASANTRRLAATTPRIQRRISGRAPYPINYYGLTGDKVNEAAPVGQLDPAAIVNVDETTLKNATGDPAGTGPGWAKVLSATTASGSSIADGWVKLSLIKTADTVGAGIEGAGMAVDAVAFTGSAASGFGASGDKIISSGTEANLNYAAGAGDIAGMFVGLASAIKTFKDADDGWDQAEAVINGISSAGKGAKGVASITKTATDSAGKSAEAAGGLAMFGDIFDGIKATFTLVKKAVELAKEADQKTNQEKFHDSMEIVSSILQVAASGVSAAKNFLDTFSTGASAALGASVPGFGVALGAADLIVRSVDLVSGMVQASRMRKDKHTHKEGLDVPAFPGVVAAETGAKGKKLQAATTYKKLVKKRENGKIVAASQEELFLNWADGNEAFQHYLFSKGLQYVNKKRVNRALLKIAVAMGKISGDVATLGGASAPVGLGLKAGAMALDVGASLFRTWKQFFRDKRAKREKEGLPISKALMMYDSKKSTTAKLREYHKMTSRIFDMILAAAALPAPSPPQPDTRFAAVTKYLAAIGISLSRVRALQTEPNKLKIEMIDALKKRE